MDGINNIKSSENRPIFADKTANLHEMTPEQYKTILTKKHNKDIPKSGKEYPTEHRKGCKNKFQNSSAG